MSEWLVLKIEIVQYCSGDQVSSENIIETFEH